MYFGCLLLDTVIVQVQQWGVVGGQQVVKQVLLNGVSLTGISQEVDSIIQTMSADALLPSLISENQTSVWSKSHHVSVMIVKIDNPNLNSGLSSWFVTNLYLTP